MAVFVIPLNDAEMVLLPMPTPVAVPLELMVATVVSPDDQATAPDMFPLVLSEKAPLAVKVVVPPLATDIVNGEMVMPVSEAAVTVMLAGGEVTMPYELPMDAVMLVVPTAMHVTTPVLLPTLAVPGVADVQVTRVVISAVVPFE